MEEKHEAHEVAEQSGFLRWLDNFWYHYKWQTIGVLFVVILFAVTIPQCTKNDEDSITVTFAGNYTMSADEQKTLKNLLYAYTDGSVTLGQYSIYTEDEIIKNNTYKDSTTGGEKVDISGKNSAKGFNQEQIQSIQSYLMTGDCGIFIVSEYVYENWFDGRIQIVENKRLGDLQIYEDYGAIRIFSADCRVLLTRSVLGETSKDKNFAEVQAFYALLTGENTAEAE